MNTEKNNFMSLKELEKKLEQYKLDNELTLEELIYTKISVQLSEMGLFLGHSERIANQDNLIKQVYKIINNN